MRSRKPSLYEQALKQIKRLERATRRAEKRGYQFDLPFRRTRTGEEKTRYTQKEVERLKSLHLKDLYKYSKVGTPETGYKSGEEYRKEEARWQAQQAARQRWANEWKRRREQEEREDRAFKRQFYRSISETVINNAMRRENWRYSDRYYEKFLEIVNRAKEINVDATAQAFQDMINAGVLQPIQQHYKPDNFFFDLAEFSEYFDGIISEDEVEELKNDDEYEEDNDGFEYIEDGLLDEIFG